MPTEAGVRAAISTTPSSRLLSALKQSPPFTSRESKGELRRAIGITDLDFGIATCTDVASQQGNNRAVAHTLHIVGSAAQLKAADKERKETKERHNEELRGKQSQINALGHLVGYALYDLAISSTTILIDDKKTRQTLAEPQERDIEKAYETVRKNALARAAKLTHLSQKQLAALITRPSNEQIAFSMANILGVEPAQPSELEVGPSNSLELAPLQVEAHKAMTPTLVHPEAQLKEESSIQHDQGCPPDTSSPGNTVELPGEPEAIELSELRRQSNSVAGATFQKRKQPPLAILKLLPQPGFTYEFEGLISMDISEADD